MQAKNRIVAMAFIGAAVGIQCGAEQESLQAPPELEVSDLKSLPPPNGRIKSWAPVPRTTLAELDPDPAVVTNLKPRELYAPHDNFGAQAVRVYWSPSTQGLATQVRVEYFSKEVLSAPVDSDGAFDTVRLDPSRLCALTVALDALGRKAPAWRKIATAAGVKAVAEPELPEWVALARIEQLSLDADDGDPDQPDRDSHPPDLDSLFDSPSPQELIMSDGTPSVRTLARDLGFDADRLDVAQTVTYRLKAAPSSAGFVASAYQLDSHSPSVVVTMEPVPESTADTAERKRLLFEIRAWLVGWFVPVITFTTRAERVETVSVTHRRLAAVALTALSKQLANHMASSLGLSDELDDAHGRGESVIHSNLESTANLGAQRWRLEQIAEKWVDLSAKAIEIPTFTGVAGGVTNTSTGAVRDLFVGNHVTVADDDEFTVRTPLRSFPVLQLHGTSAGKEVYRTVPLGDPEPATRIEDLIFNFPAEHSSISATLVLGVPGQYGFALPDGRIVDRCQQIAVDAYAELVRRNLTKVTVLRGDGTPGTVLAYPTGKFEFRTGFEPWNVPWRVPTGASADWTTWTELGGLK